MTRDWQQTGSCPTCGHPIYTLKAEPWRVAYTCLCMALARMQAEWEATQAKGRTPAEEAKGQLTLTESNHA